MKALESVLRLCKSRLVALVASAVLAPVAGAACSTTYCDNVSVDTLYMRNDGNAFLKVDGTMSNLTCTLYGSTYATLAIGTTGFKEMYATLMANQLAGRPIAFTISSGSSGCTITGVWVDS